MNNQSKEMLKVAKTMEEWHMFLRSLSQKEKEILVALGMKRLTSPTIAADTFSRENATSAQLSRLVKNGVLSRDAEGFYVIENSDLAKAAASFMVKEFNLKDVKNYITSEVYQCLVGIYESLEHKNLISGSGHHMAQKMAQAASEIVEERWLDEGN